MAIQPYVDNVSKKVIQPQVNIGGIWKDVSIVSHNINGAWRESFNKNVYKVYLYRYGVHYDTLTVAKGSSVKLPEVGNVYADDVEHYGWTKTAGATSRDYSTTQSITPTGDVTLHAVFKAVTKVESTITVTSSGNRTTSGIAQTVIVAYDGTITVKGGMSGSVSTPNGSVSISGSYTTGSNSSADSYFAINNSYKTITLGSSSGSTSMTYNVSKDDVITFKVGMASEPMSAINMDITYPAMVDSFFYRSSYGDITLTFYDSTGSVWRSETVAQGSKYTIPTTFPINIKNNVFRGWGNTQDSDNVKYNMGSTYQLSQDINLYPLYYGYSYIDTDGDGYFTITGHKKISVSGFSNQSGPFGDTDYNSYTMNIIFTDGTTKSITLGNSEGNTTVTFDSNVGISSFTKPEDSSSSSGENQDQYEGWSATTTITHYSDIKRYIN